MHSEIMELLSEGYKDVYTYIYTYIHTYIHIYMCVCVCVYEMDTYIMEKLIRIQKSWNCHLNEGYKWMETKLQGDCTFRPGVSSLSVNANDVKLYLVANGEATLRSHKRTASPMGS
jgi:hypothetical protein